jgi:hypothetical protein
MPTHPSNTPVSVPIIIFIILLTVLPHPTLSKFSNTYSGIAATGLQACLSNSTFTPSSLTQRENCRDGFRCVMDNIPGLEQSILSSGAAILGFIHQIAFITLGAENGCV